MKFGKQAVGDLRSGTREWRIASYMDVVDR